jgi:peptidoglycan hydrolase-like protein with peptidoglycan-binding domain
MKLAYCAAASAFALLIMTSASVAQDGRYVDSGTVRQVQQTLNQRGVRIATDGVMGPRTEAAIKTFQRSQNLEPTGQLNRQTLAALGLEPRVTEPTPTFVYGATTIRQAQQTLNNRGFKAGPADGVMGPSMQAALMEFQRSENLEPSGYLNPRTLSALGIKDQPISTAPSPVLVPSANAATIRQVQQALKSRGYLAGPVDGVMDPSTEHAIREFQRAEALENTGRLNRQTLSALGVQGA